MSRFSVIDVLNSLLARGSRRDSGSSFGTTYPYSLSFSEDDTSTLSAPSTVSSPSSSPSRSFSFRLPRTSFSPRRSTPTLTRPRITKRSTDSVLSVATSFSPPIEECITTLRTVEAKHARELRQAQDTNEQLQTLLEVKHEELAGARNDLAVVSGEEGGRNVVEADPGLIICELKTLNSTIKSLCASLVALYPPPTRTSIPVLDAAHPLTPLLSPLMAHRDTQDMSHRRLLLALLEATTCHILLENIFTRFHPSLRRDWDGMLVGMYKHMVRSEPQLACGRWRSQAYRTVSHGIEAEADVPCIVVDRLCLDLGMLCDLFRCEPPSFDRDALSRLVRDAIALHTGIQRDAISFDWMPMLTSRVEGCVTALGLEASRGVPMADGTIFRDVKGHVEPIVVKPVDLITI